MLAISLDTIASQIKPPRLCSRKAHPKTRQNRQRQYRLRQLYPDGLCSYCGERRPLTIEHVEPLAIRGRRNSWENLVPACEPCNNKKGDLPLLIFLLRSHIRRRL